MPAPPPVPPLVTETPALAEAPSTEVSEVVVTARRIGVPVWRVGDGRSSFVFVGSIGSVPESVPWNADVLEQAVAGSRKVLHSADVSFTAGDLFRVVFRRGRYTDLPRGQSLETLTGPVLAARLDAAAAADRIPEDWRELRAWWVAARLAVGLSREREVRRGVTPLRAAERAARRARIPVEPVIRARFNDVLSQAAQERPSDLGCLQAVAAANEAGLEGVRARARAWTRSRLQEIAASPLSRAEASCWPEADPASAPALRQAWRTAVRRELAQPGVVVAIAPVRYLVESGGLLDDLQRQGFVIDGPAWR